MVSQPTAQFYQVKQGRRIMFSSGGALPDDVIEVHRFLEDYFRSKRGIFSSLSGVCSGTNWSQT